MSWNEMLDSKIFGDIVTGLTTSAIFLALLFMLKPSISISPKISSQYKTINGQKQLVYFFKIMNKSWLFRVYDITVRAYICETIPNANGNDVLMRDLELKGITQWVLNRFNPRHCFQDTICGEGTLKSRSDYAVQFACGENIKNLLNHRKYITIQVLAKHSLTGFSTVETKHYHHLSKVEDGIFLTGNSFKIVKNMHANDNIIVT